MFAVPFFFLKKSYFQHPSCSSANIIEQEQVMKMIYKVDYLTFLILLLPVFQEVGAGPISFTFTVNTDCLSYWCFSSSVRCVNISGRIKKYNFNDVKKKNTTTALI